MVDFSCQTMMQDKIYLICIAKAKLKYYFILTFKILRTNENCLPVYRPWVTAHNETNLSIIHKW